MNSRHNPPTLFFAWKRLPRWLLALLAGLMPALVTLLLIRLHLGGNLLDYMPTNWTDQLLYWHQIENVSRVGLDTGYTSVYEREPIFLRFSAAGPVYPILYGLIGRIVGWQTYTGILLNMALVAAGAWLFIGAARLDHLQIVLAALALVTVTTVLFYMPSIMQESVHHAAALALAAVFYRLLRGEQSSWLKWAALIFLTLMALMRFSWTLLFLPFFLLNETRLTLLRVGWALVKTAALTALILAVVQATSAPGDNSIFARLAAFYPSPVQGWQSLLVFTRDNIQSSFMAIHDLNRLTIEHLQGGQFMLALMVALVGVLATGSRREMLFHLYNLGTVLALALAFYLLGGFYRLFAPHLLITLMLWIACRRFAPVLACIMIAVLLGGAFLGEYRRELAPNFHRDSAQVERVGEIFSATLEYRPGAANPWCNTILFPVELLDYRVILVPPGLGISYYVHPNRLEKPLRSRYVLLRDQDYAALGAPLNVQVLASMEGGSLYANLDAECPGGS